MSSAGKYRRYPPEIKDEIARTGNIHLFPSLKIPRATAQAWLKRKLRASPSDSVSSEVEIALRARAGHYQRELEKERALRKLLEFARRVFPFDFSDRYVKSKSTRAAIMKAVRECAKDNGLPRSLAAIGLSKSSYQRWRAENSYCEKSKLKCARRSPTQLTADELKTLKRLVTSRRYAYLAITSLHLYAQREGLLFCSLYTWYKYIRYYGWTRPWSSKPKKIIRSGYRASRVNQTWHIDVTVITLRPGHRVYLQAVIDSFSRFVLAWRVTSTIGASSTIKTVRLAQDNSRAILGRKTDAETMLMMDPGSENANSSVAIYLTSANMKRVLAQVDIRQSNSMIETLFNSLKNRHQYGSFV